VDEIGLVVALTTQHALYLSTTALVISRTSRDTIGGRSFPAATTSVWNSLPEVIRSSASLVLFRKLLKTELFTRSFTSELSNLLY